MKCKADKNRYHAGAAAMSHPREPYDRLFDRFNTSFARIAAEEGVEFEVRAGPNLGRTLRLKNDPLLRGVFLELKHHWSKSDPVDPEVTLGWGAWFRPNPPGFPLHFLSKRLYAGKLSGVQESVLESRLRAALNEINAISQEQVVREGKVFNDFPKNPDEAGSYYL
jgi:hypothetical protein